jgi:cytochrome P450
MTAYFFVLISKLTKLFHKFPASNVTCTRDGYTNVYLINDFNTARSFIKCKKTRSYPHLGYIFDTLLSRSIGVTNGDEWLIFRKPLKEHFTKTAVENRKEVIIQQIDDWIETYYSNNGIIHSSNELHVDDLMITIISKIIYGVNDELTLRKFKDLLHDHNHVMNIMASDMILRLPSFILSWIPSQNKRFIDEFKCKWYATNNDMMDICTPDSLLYKISHNKTYQDCDALNHTLYEIFLFNIDIMVNSFSSLLYDIASDQDIQDNILNSYRYLDAVVNESARLNPGIPITFSETLLVDNVDYNLKKGDVISLNSTKINRDPSVWNNPDEFNFGLSSRKCLGMNYGDYILKLLIIQLLNKYRFSIANQSENKLCTNVTILNLPKFSFPQSITYDSRQ